MDRISGLSDELLAKILSFVPTKVVVSTSILSKRWEFLWMCVPKLEFKRDYYGSEKDPGLGDFINKNLPLLRAPVIESFRLECDSSFQPEDINRWVAFTLSRCIRELDLDCEWCTYSDKPAILLPSSLYTCESLVTLKLNGDKILVDVPRTVSFPSLKNLLLGSVTYRNKDCLRLLLSYCPVLEDLVIHRESSFDNADPVVVISPSLLSLTLPIVGGGISCYAEYVIVTPSLKYFKVEEHNGLFEYVIAHMPEVEEADINVDEYLERIFESITSVKRLSLCVLYNIQDGYTYHDGIFFSQLEHLKLCIRFDYWSKLLFRLLQDSPKLRFLSLSVDIDGRFKKYEPINWNNDQISVPSCLLESLETFEFVDYRGKQEERDFVSFIIKNACHLKSSSITPCTRIAESYSSTESSDD